MIRYRGRPLEFRRQASRRFQVHKIVVGKFLALQLFRGGQPARRAPCGNIQRRGLVRIFSVAQRLLHAQRNMQPMRQRLPYHSSSIAPAFDNSRSSSVAIIPS